MAETTSKIIPNSYQTPNFLVDVIMRLLTGNEQKCVDVICRKTFGWQKRSDRISKSQLIELTGLGSNSVDTCMSSLVKYRVVIRLSESIHNWGVEWSIQTNDSLIDLRGLENRNANHRKMNQQRAAKARHKRQVGMSGMGGMSDMGSGGMSDMPHKSHYQKPKDSSSPGGQEKIISFFKQEIGKVTPTIQEKLLAAKAYYTEEWVLEALSEAVTYNKPSWAYAEAILKRWKQEGKVKGGKKYQGNNQHRAKKSTTAQEPRKRSSEELSAAREMAKELLYTDKDREAARRAMEKRKLRVP